MITIERPLPEDAQKISDIHRQIWHETYDGILPPEKIDAMLDASHDAQLWHFREVAKGNQQQHFLLVIKDEGGKIVGFSDVRADENEARVKAIYILKAYQRKGFGSMIIQKSFSWLDDHLKVFVDVVLENRPAIRFFENFGFISSGNIESVGGIKIMTLVYNK